MATRVFELARELGVTSKHILAKCSAEGLELKNHMATLSAGLQATIREWFTEAPSGTAVETAAHVDLGKAREAGKRQRRRRGEAEAPAVEAPPPAEAEAPVAVAEAPAVVVEAAPAPAVAAEAAPMAPPIETTAPPPVEEAPAAPAPAAGPVGQPAAPPVPGPTAAASPAGPQPPAPPPKPEVKPAGPQLVPGPARLRGPRIVRVERPDVLVPRSPRPSSRPATGASSPGASSTGAAAPGAATRRGGKPAIAPVEEEADGKKAKRRSPRRRGGGRSADSGEKLREWRDKDLAERSLRLAAASGGTLRRHRASISHKAQEGGPAVAGEQIAIAEPITVKSLSAATGIKTSEIIAKLMQNGTPATINQVLAKEQAEAAIVDHGIDLVVRAAPNAEREMLADLQTRPAGATEARAPVVTFMGHVDHGKTSLLDRIRHATVAAGETGGITQHVGAYRYDVGDRHVAFLDTPGHEAFTAMRARGANMTDVVVLVVAADDGVMPQTVEALSHAKAANVPIVVALNKVDLPNANVQRVMGQLAEHGLNPRQWGGEVEVIETSAATGQGVDTLLETLSLMAEILELKAEAEAPARGFVVESEISPRRGAIGRLLVLDGTLRVGDILQAGMGYGRVRRMVDHLGRVVTEAGPSTPVEVSGLDEIPQAGDRFYVVDELEQAQQVAEDHRQAARTASLAPVPPTPQNLQGILDRIQAGQANELAIIVKADVQGSVEALVGAVGKLGTDEVRVKVLHAAAGGITAGDVTLAEASGAVIIGFNVVPDAAARQLAEEHGVDVRLYRIIYEVIDDIREAMEKGLAPEIRMETTGRADVRQVFKVSRVGTVAGCMVSDGVVARNARVRLIRNSVVVEDDRSLESLKRFKDDAREVRAGMECGLKIAGYDDVKEGDILEFYQKIEVARKL